MTEIKTAQAWGWLGADGNLRDCWVAATHPDGEPVHFRGVIVHGLSEAEVHEAAALRDACRELGIETVEQLKARLAPDPRVALLDVLGVKGKKNLIELLSAVVPHKYINEAIDKLIAAQRGEEQK